jgi:hypothetical protein
MAAVGKCGCREGGTVPSTVAPSLNDTLPVDVPDAVETVAVKVTDCPGALGLSEDVTAVDVEAEVTDVVTVAELFAALGSAVALEIAAVLLMLAAAVLVTLATRVKAADPPLANDKLVQLIVPVAPAAGVVQVHPAGDVRLAKVRPAGSVSVMAADAAAAGPALAAASA